MNAQFKYSREKPIIDRRREESEELSTLQRAGASKPAKRSGKATVPPAWYVSPTLFEALHAPRWY
jgi:hypothetical protein